MSEVVVNDVNFETEVLQASMPVMVDFWATWCGPCRMLGPMVEELAREYEGRIKVCKVNVDEAPKAASTYGIATVPTIILFNEGKVVEQLVGLQSKAGLQSKLEGLL